MTVEIVLIDNINSSSSRSGSRINRTLDGSATVEYGLEKECCERVLNKHIVMKGHAQHLLTCVRRAIVAAEDTKKDEREGNLLVLCSGIYRNRETLSPEDEARADGQMSQ